MLFLESLHHKKCGIFFRWVKIPEGDGDSTGMLSDLVIEYN